MWGTKKIEHIKEIEARELACLIDTEGSIHPCKQRDYYYPEITLEMADVIPVKMAEKWGGRITKYEREHQEKRTYCWSLQRRKLLQLFIPKIRLYLKIRREQADVALQMIDILNFKPKRWKEKLVRLAEELRRLNDRQPPDIDLTTLKGVARKQ